jgi:asparagine synthase (glutamine-hydrolysing)
MCAAIAHRGPDDEGCYVAGSVGLGVRRLSIIDLAGGKQPIRNEDSTIQLVFNGEIYNYRELRKALEARGHLFYTQTDTEVIVHAYEEDGEACFEKLRGMFALALWDERSQVVLLAVDRFGIKPLYYTATVEGVAFGSELKCLQISGMLKQEMDVAALAEYFTFGYIPPPATIFRGVRKLPPGFLVRWTRSGGAAVRQYWDVPRGSLERTRTVARTRGELREHLRDAVRSHLVSDVPVGVLLSGGIDSSAIVALMSEVGADPVKTFSIGFADREHNELEYARLVARRFGTDHHEFVVEPEALDILPRLVGHFGEPFADSSAVPAYYVSKMAREFVKVVLSGDGGDELFVGYTLFRGLELARHLQAVPRPLLGVFATAPAILSRIGRPAWIDRISRWQKQLADCVLPPEQAYRSKITKIGVPAIAPLLSSDLLERLVEENPYRTVDAWLARYPAKDDRHPLERFVYAGLKVSLPGDMLVKVDRASMANSLEVRVPLLDHVLADFTATIPIEQRLPHWRLKGLFKDTMSDVLPAQILRHPKHGFTVPLAAWFRGNLTGFAADVLLSTEARQRGLLNVGATEAMLSRHRDGRQSLGTLIWAMLIFELWCRQALD